MTESVTTQAGSQVRRSQWTRLKEVARDYLPEGRALPDAEWSGRHRAILIIIFGHAIGLTIFGFMQGWGPAYSLGEGGLIAALGLVASWKKLGRRFRSGTAALALVASSSVLTQFWGGYIEGHFHFFIVVALVVLYQDWAPFLLAVLYVALDHGIVGTLAPEWVYNHPDAIANPWKWAAAHAVLVLGECAVLLYVWKASERSSSQVDLLMNAAGEAIMGLDREGRVAFANPAASVLTGRRLTELLGHPVTEFLRAEGEDPSDSDASAWADHHTQGDDVHVVRGDGKTIPVIWARSPILEHGAVVGHVMTLMDATPHKQAEEERRQRVRQLTELEQLKKVNSFKTLFINTAAHELHTPLTPLRLNLFALREGHRGSLTAEQTEVVDILERNVERLSLLVEDVLNAARLQANRLAISKESVDLATVAQETLSAFGESAKRVGVRLQLVAEPGVRIDGDSRRLSQVLYNLVDNAIKFSPKGGEVEVAVRSHNGSAVLEVKDEGAGIDPQDQHLLFQPFSQVHDSMQMTRSGSGLGLYITKGIVDLHGGRITCESRGRGQGTTFRVVFPRAENPVAA